jgi:hypothetical protein
VTYAVYYTIIEKQRYVERVCGDLNDPGKFSMVTTSHMCDGTASIYTRSWPVAKPVRGSHDTV